MFAIVPGGSTLGLIVLGLVALVAVFALLWLAVGLFQARSLLRRELSAYFYSPIGYVVLFVFLTVTGWLFWVTLDLLTAGGPRGTEWPMRTLFGDYRFWLVFLFIPPLLTMRLFAEERSSGTLEMLMTAPLRDWQVVLSKYLACLGFYVVLWLPTLAYLPALLGATEPVWHNAWTVWSIGLVAGLGSAILGLLLLLPRLGTVARLVSLVLIVGGAAVAIGCGWAHYHRDAEHLLEIPVGIDPYPVLATYLALLLAGAMFLALGLLVSSWVRNQMVSAVITFGLELVFIAAGFWKPEMEESATYGLLYFFSVPLHFDRAFTRGLVDTQPLILYASTAVLCLFLTARSLEIRRWQ
jgi:ABC-type transport system involved in multi-copper enzyme maturation permease subunit